jgi:AraC-like DNA-binding protein
MSSPATGRTSEHRSAEIQERDLAKQVADALVVDFGHYKSTHKTIAQHAGASPETVKRWVAADSAPSLVYFLRLLPHSPALQGVVRRLCKMEADLDPNFQQAFTAFMQLMGKR